MAIAFALGATLAAIIEFAGTYFIAPPRMPAGLYYAITLFVAGFGISVLMGQAWAASVGMLVGQIVYFVLTSTLLPLHPMLLVGLVFMIGQSVVALLGAWLGQALW